ncbi:MAG: ATP-binding protein [Anaerolineae bacterium]|jgi:hypothetical protein|nr:ATP-binding protein [Anaerolineae bacterium]
MPSGAESVHERICQWIEQSYRPQQPDQQVLVLSPSACCHLTALRYVRAGFDVGDGLAYAGYSEQPCAIISSFTTFFEDQPTFRTGALLFRFAPGDGGGAAGFQVLLVSAWVDDEDVNANMLAIACVPSRALPAWLKFEKECTRIANSAIPFRGRVYVMGGAEATFDATVNWDDIYLPARLKDDILQDVDSFFKKGVAIYRRLNIKPFRKLLFAGVPGTGKTMLCSAIAKWGQAQGYFVVYVSGSNRYGAKFWKIHEALDMAASSEAPTIVLVEELDSYLEEDSRAQMLNVLDGTESPENKFGTLLIATTNHPEAIDTRVLKRPGRLDRIFIIPEMNSEDDAGRMLQNYLGDSWREEHRGIIPALVGKPGAFIRETALYALTLAAYQNYDHLPLKLLRDSLRALEDQIEAKDDFLTAHRKTELGLHAVRKPKKRQNGLLLED